MRLEERQETQILEKGYMHIILPEQGAAYKSYKISTETISDEILNKIDKESILNIYENISDLPTDNNVKVGRIDIVRDNDNAYIYFYDKDGTWKQSGGEAISLTDIPNVNLDETKGYAITPKGAFIIEQLAINATDQAEANRQAIDFLLSKRETTDVIEIADMTTETVSGIASTQSEANVDFTTAIFALQDTVRLISGGAVAIALQSTLNVTTSYSAIPFNITFSPTNPDVLDANDTSNTLIAKVQGVYSWAVAFGFNNPAANQNANVSVGIRFVDDNSFLIPPVTFVVPKNTPNYQISQYTNFLQFNNFQIDRNLQIVIQSNNANVQLINYTANVYTNAAALPVAGLSRFAEPTALAIRSLTGYSQGVDAINYNSLKLYEFDASSTSVDDGTDSSFYLKPNNLDVADAGRWVLRNQFLGIEDNGNIVTEMRNLNDVNISELSKSTLLVRTADATTVNIDALDEGGDITVSEVQANFAEQTIQGDAVYPLNFIPTTGALGYVNNNILTLTQAIEAGKMRLELKMHIPENDNYSRWLNLFVKYPDNREISYYLGEVSKNTTEAVGDGTRVTTFVFNVKNISSAGDYTFTLDYSANNAAANLTIKNSFIEASTSLISKQFTFKQEYMSTILQGKGVDNVTLRKRDGKLEWVKDNDYETPTLKFKTLASEEDQYFMFGSSGIIGKYNNVEFEGDYSGPLVEDAEMEVTHIHGIKCLSHLGLNYIKGDLDLRCVSTPNYVHISNSVIDNLSLSSRKAVVSTSAGFYANRTTFLKPIDFSVLNKFYTVISFQDCIMSQEVLESTLESLLSSFSINSYGFSGSNLITYYPTIDISYYEIEYEIEYAGRLETLIQTLGNSGWIVNIPQSWWGSKKQQRDFSKVNYEKLEAEWRERYGFRINDRELLKAKI